MKPDWDVVSIMTLLGVCMILVAGIWWVLLW